MRPAADAYDAAVVWGIELAEVQDGGHGQERAQAKIVAAAIKIR